MSGNIRRLCVFCGSGAGARPEYSAAAAALGRELALREIGLVYGGASVGLMGVVADATLEAGGEVVGVIPGALAAREIAHRGLTKLHVVESMHERKALMASLCDGFIALPGGIGTLEELFEVWTWAQLGLHGKPVALLNVRGYYDPLLAFLDASVTEGFVRPEVRAMLLTHAAPTNLLDLVATHDAPKAPRWLDSQRET